MKCKIIGVLDNGSNGLTPASTETIKAAEVVIAAQRTLTLFADLICNAEQKDLTGNLPLVPEWINSAITAKQSVVVLATGDPLCHGIASYLYKKLDAGQLSVIPNVSSIQLAFAQTGLSWQDAKIISIHSKDTGEWRQGAVPSHGMYPLLQAVLNNNKLAILTSPDNTPDRIARMLQIENLADMFNMIVAEDLLTDHQRVLSQLSIDQIATESFNGNNIVILQRKQQQENKIIFGLPDHSFQQRKPDKGLITKREVRAVSLARMQLKIDSIVWDIGAGSGSVGLEAAQIARQGYVFAIEKNAADYEIAGNNARSLNIYNYQLSHDKAPACLDNWPDPDAIFIGGSGGELNLLIKLCLERLHTGGCLVMNFVTVENLSTAVTTLDEMDADWDMTQMQCSRSQPILHMHRFKAENPVWIITAHRKIS